MESMSRTALTEPLRFSDELARTVFDSLSAHIAILDENGTIVLTNEAWRRFAEKSRVSADYNAIGENYLAICDRTTGDEKADARKVSGGIRQVIAGEIDEFLYDYPCHSPTGRHWYYLRVIRMGGDGPVKVVASHEEITELKLAEERLRQSREQLDEQKQSLEEANIALKVLLKQREADKVELEQKVLTNVKELVFPYLDKLKGAPLKPREKTLVEIVASHLEDIISPLLQRLSSANILLTPQEMQVAALVKDGKTSKEIADILNISEATANFHRKNLRVKFGLRNRKTNLRAYLMSLK